MKNLNIYFLLLILFFGSIEAKAVFTVDGVHYWLCSAGGDSVKVGPYSMRDIFNVRPEYYGDVVIPAKVTYEGKTYRVIGIMECAFQESNAIFSGKPALRSVKIEAPITEIPYKCFFYSDVEVVSLPPTVTPFGNYSFSNCSKLKTVEIPSSAPLVSLGEQCFLRCTNLKELNLPNTVRDMGKECFCLSGLISFKVPESMTYLPENCFSGSQLQEISIPLSVNRLGKECFSETNLKDFDFPWSVNEIHGDELSPKVLSPKVLSQE